MENKDKPNLDDWMDFSGNFIKSENVTEYPALFVCTKVNTEWDKNNKPRLLATIEYAKRFWTFDINATNQKVLKKCGIKSPNDLIGKKIFCDKIKVRNPTTSEIVDSLSILKVE